MKTKILSCVFLILGTGLAVVALPDPPAPPALNPPPAPDYTCKATGDGAICRVERIFPVEGEPAAFVCGTADNPVQLLGYGTFTQRFTRYYNRAGDLTRRFDYETDQETLVNPVTGLSATITEKANFKDTLTTPGDFSSVTTTITGVLVKVVLPGSGVLFLDAGRTIVDAEGEPVSHSGRADFFNYFTGNHAAATQLCSALSSPGTP